MYEKRTNCHKEKIHKLRLSPIAQVDGHLGELGIDMVSQQNGEEHEKEELPPLPKNPIGYSCGNFEFKCGGHQTLTDHIRSCQASQASKASR